MSKRSIWKGPFVELSLFSSFLSAKKSSKKINIKTRSRKSTILPAFVGRTFLVYNGKSYLPIKIKSNMVGCKLGEFSPTRVRHVFKKKDKKGR